MIAGSICFFFIYYITLTTGYAWNVPEYSRPECGKGVSTAGGGKWRQVAASV
ncbi:MAG: hypothetical protein HQK99_15400 [Nitrospirae bacterium]|nr:hypothetical protein [Nitrospirota bacterium]